MQFSVVFAVVFHSSVPDWLICKPIGDRWGAVLFLIEGSWGDSGLYLVGEDFEEVEFESDAYAE